MDGKGAKADFLTPNYHSPALQITNNLYADSGRPEEAYPLRIGCTHFLQFFFFKLCVLELAIKTCK